MAFAAMNRCLSSISTNSSTQRCMYASYKTHERLGSVSKCIHINKMTFYTQRYVCKYYHGCRRPASVWGRHQKSENIHTQKGYSNGKGLNLQQKQFCSQCTFIDGNLPPHVKHQPPWNVLFFGSDDFSLETLKALNESRTQTDIDPVVDNLDVVVLPELSKKNPVITYAQEQNLQIYEWPHGITAKYDVGVVVSFGRLIPGKIIHMFPFGIVNVHASLLPRWRGASPITHTILNGDKYTGISIMEIRPKHFDIGPILAQKKVPVPHKCTAVELEDILKVEGANMLINALHKLPVLERFEQEQDTSGITYAHKIDESMATINWSNQTVQDIDRQYRAVTHKFPLKTEFAGRMVKLLDILDLDQNKECSHIISNDARIRKIFFSIAPGTPFYYKKERALFIKCLDGWVGFRRLTLNGKVMTAEAFNCGYLLHGKNEGVNFLSMQNMINKYIHRIKVIAA